MAGAVAPKTTIKDAYVNFKRLAVTATNPITTIACQNHDTGLSSVAGFGWQIHGIQVYIPLIISAGTVLEIAISTRKDLTIMPKSGDGGCLAQFIMASTGAQGTISPLQLNDEYLPPMLIASPNLSMYVKASVACSLSSTEIQARISYTTKAITDKMYIELIGTWENSNG